MNLEILNNRILVEPIKAENTVGGIYVERNEAPRCGKVVGVGPKVKEVGVGDIVWFVSGWSYREVEVETKKYLVCFEADIFAKNAKNNVGKDK